MRIEYRGIPIKLVSGNNPISWLKLPLILRHYRNGDILVDGWKFNLEYGLIYLCERNHWTYYKPPTGFKNKVVVDLGAGCGETAKYFIDNGALKVYAFEPNPDTWKYLDYNSVNNPELIPLKMGQKVKTILSMDFDILKMDTEGYEAEFIPYLDSLRHVDIFLEAHSDYCINSYLNSGFKSLDRLTHDWIHRDIANLYRLAEP